MENKVVIEGEAPETDSDEDVYFHHDAIPSKMTKSIQGAIIPGEASESEDENGSSISSAVSVLTQQPNNKPPVTNIPPEADEVKYNSLLHKKLKERNRLFHNNLQICTHNVINEAAKDLTSIDQQLLKSQVTLQSAVNSLRVLNQNTSALKTRLDFVISSAFFPNVRLSHIDKN